MNTYKKTKEILNKYGIKANKRFGQNFLIDDNILQGILNSADIKDNELVIEIGPGLGNLTEYLLSVSSHVMLIEIDNNMIEILTDRFETKNNYTLINCDVLKIDLDEKISDIEKKLNTKFDKVKVVANLPYYVTSPILFKLLKDSKRIDEIVVMVQKEVAERMIATPSKKDYSVLTVMVKYFADSNIEIVVPSSSFIPAPNVTSAVIKLIKNKKYNLENEEDFFQMIHFAFAQRRKKMINSLESNHYHDLSKDELTTTLKLLNIDENVRAEALDLDTLVRIFNQINE